MLHGLEIGIAKVPVLGRDREQNNVIGKFVRNALLKLLKKLGEILAILALATTVAGTRILLGSVSEVGTQLCLVCPSQSRYMPSNSP